MKLFHWYTGLGLATKQFIYLFFVTLTLFMVLAWNNLNEAESLFKEQVTRDAELLVARTNQFIDASLDGVENILLLLSTRHDLLADGNEQAAVETLQKYASYNSSVAKTLYIVRADGKVYSNSQVFYEVIGNPHLKELYNAAPDNYGAINVSEPYYSPMSGQTIAYMRPITDRSNQVKGVVIAEVNLELLTSRIAPMIYQSFTLITANGNVINRLDPRDKLLPFQPKTYPPVLEPYFSKQLKDLKVGVGSIYGNNEPLIAVKSNKNRLGWSLIAFIAEDYFYHDLQRLYNNYRTATVIWVIILLISAFTLSRQFTRPIRRLVDKMDRLDDFHVVPKLSETRRDEIGRLAKSYNAMLERIHYLLQETKRAEERKKEYELKMLRSQIAPHFLYNTLACISSLAKQRKIDEVRDTIRSLVKLLSFSFDKNTEFVSIEEELEGLTMYMQIQQVRFGTKYAYSFDIDPSVMHCKILKLTLQPLVENALFHGIAPKGGGRVTIKGRSEQGKLRLFVRDDGVGLARENIPLLTQRSEAEASKHRFTGIGLNNVHERIRIHYGSSYGLRIGSMKGVGTVVRIDLPLS
ncbi:cache domain-containing sensor histidine kinase [Paenibacillus alkalitolerans]|uniref:cache domain-containing sensor histidine kinase n=1 Tax=Paenibacillus alkalitolerans TaxID=2799335 RepID=UPI0018F4B5D6|nr:sensor histidine kinase [Paenibacillus alkalitolerans]